MSGSVTDDEGQPVVGVPVRLIRVSADAGDIFYTTTDDSGRYNARLIPGDGYSVSLDDEGWLGEPQRASGGRDTEMNLEVFRRGPAPDEVVAWIRANAIPLESARAESGFEDMHGLRALVGQARVVALGEATHGTREFFQLKHRILEYLVEEMDFRVFAIEANWPECLAINDYVLFGEGDSR